jgi:hypothetical protein
MLPQIYWPRIKADFWIANSHIVLHLLGMPLLYEGAEFSSGYITLVPSSFRHEFVEDHFWIFIAAVHLIWTMDKAPAL